MSDPIRWDSLSPDAVRAAGDAEARSDARLSEAAAREALSLRHASTSPAMLGLTAQAVETGVLALALWGALGGLSGGLAGAGTALAGAAAATLLARAAGAYRMGRLRRLLPGGARAVAGALAAAALAALGLMLAGRDPSEAAVPALAAVETLALTRLVIAPVVNWCVQAGLTDRRAVLVGGGEGAERVIRGLDALPDNDIRIAGIFDDRDDVRSPPLVAGARKLGGVAELIEFCRIAHVDLLIVTLPLTAEGRILKLLSQLWVLPIDIRLAASADAYNFPRRAGGADAGLISVMGHPLGHGGRALKRALDVTVALAAIVALSPVLLAAALAVKLTSPGPVIFRQLRHGYNNRPVEIWKFRSMRAEAADPTARKVVTRGDPRVTAVGRFIRKTSIDELPQLFNVLRGDLSLVGPRPHVLDAVSSQAQTFAEIVAGYSGRHRTPPGITGWAQINGWRGEIDSPDKLRRRFEHDLHYIENWSIWFDLYILALTPIRLFRTENAY